MQMRWSSYVLGAYIFLACCATVPTEKEIGTMCAGFSIEYHSGTSYPILPIETLNAMLRTCRTQYHGCLHKVIQSTRYTESWYAICRAE